MQLAAPTTGCPPQAVNRLKPVHTLSNTTWFGQKAERNRCYMGFSAAKQRKRCYPTLPRFLTGRDGNGTGRERERDENGT